MRMAFYRRVLGIALLGSASVLSSSMLAGCGSFFSCEGKTSCGTGTSGTNSGDYVYVSNSLSGNTYVSEYTLTSGALAPISGASEINLEYVPVAMVVAPKNGFLYVASRADAPSPGAGVYVYSISSTGALSPANNGEPFSNDQGIASMDISPDGTFLFTVGDSSQGPLLTEYPLNSTTGLAEPGTPLTFPASGLTPITALTTVCSIVQSGTPLSQECTVKVSPSSDYVAVAVAGSGFEVFPYSSSGGIPKGYVPQQASPPNAGSADFSLAFDKNNFLYVASTTALTSFDGLGATLTQEKSVAFSTGTSDIRPRSVTVSADSGFVYTANEGSGTISGFSLPGSGVMTALAGSPVVGPANVSALGVDSTGKYLLAAGFGLTNGLQVFNISSTGLLTPGSNTEGTGSDDTAVPIVMALSH
jgi:6-phosphogluconolactonase